MYYHVILELGDEFHKNSYDKSEISSDITDKNKIVSKFVEPYEIGTPIMMNGRTIPTDQIERLRIYSSEKSAKELVRIAEDESKRSSSYSNTFFIGFVTNELESVILMQNEITDDLITCPKGAKHITANTINNKSKPTRVFIVHGHDDGLIYEVKAFLSAQSIEPVILREQHDGSLTIIEKLEKYITDTSIGFGIVLYTPDDEGKAKDEKSYNFRARQNVVFEHGLLIGQYTRSRVACLVKKEGDIEMPGDFSGIVYTDHSYKDWRLPIAKMLSDAGYHIDYTKIS